MGLYRFWPICLTSLLSAGVSFKPDPSLNNKDFESVGKIEVLNSAGSCVLIHDGSWVITAKHVFKDSQGNLISNPTKTQITLGDCCFTVKEIYYHPQADLAICKLNQKSNIKPLRINKVALEENQIIWSAGYGVSSVSTDPQLIKFDNTYGKFNVIANRIDGATFDRENIYYIYTPKLDEKAVPGEGIIGLGDSGGGVFAKENGKFTIVGINIGLGGREENGCLIDGIGFFLPLDYYKQWIYEIIVDNSPVPNFE